MGEEVRTEATPYVIGRDGEWEPVYEMDKPIHAGGDADVPTWLGDEEGSVEFSVIDGYEEFVAFMDSLRESEASGYGNS